VTLFVAYCACMARRQHGGSVSGARKRVVVLVALVAVVSVLLAFEQADAQPIEPVEQCQLSPGSTAILTHSGFPFSSDLVASTGTYRAAALFVDFNDRPNTESTQDAFAAAWQPEAAEFFEEQSQGRIDIQVTPVQQWLRMSRDFAQYSLGINGTSSTDIVSEAVALADPLFDFTDFDSVWIFFEKTAERNGGEAWLTAHPPHFVNAEDGAVSFNNALILGTYNFGPATSAFDQFDGFLAHEILHTMGLPDLYNWERTTDVGPPESWRFVGNFDPMGVFLGFAGGTLSGAVSPRNGSELMVWQRWQLGWVNDTQVLCVTDAVPVERILTPIAEQGGKKALVVRLGETTVLVAELRTQLRYDADLEAEGVLVYTVDSEALPGDGPIRVLGDHDGDFPNASGLLQPGEAIEHDNYTVTVGAATPEGYEVRIDGPATCQGQLVTINMRANGGNGIGTAGDDVILGTVGDDVIDAGAGNDLVCAGRGNDTVVGSEGEDELYGEAGDDVIRGGPGNDELNGDSGSDRLFGGSGEDSISGGNGADFLGGFGGADTISGGNGDDLIFGGFGGDTIFGGAGNDEIHGLVGNDVIHGDAGDDLLFGERGNDVIDGGAGDDVGRGGNANDILDGGEGDDEVHGGKADDSLSGGNGTDLCVGNTQLVADVAGPDCETTFGVP